MKSTDEVFDLGLLVETLDCYAYSRLHASYSDKGLLYRSVTIHIKDICSLMGFKKPKTKQVLLALEAQE